MGAKQDIVIVNEYTIQNNNKRGGSRGGSPGDYVLRYMAREEAVEKCTPALLYSDDNYTTRYTAREEAAEILDTSEEICSGIRDLDGIGGVAFGYGSHSLSHEKVIEASKDIQTNFEAGKTVMKTVISFDPEYLSRMGIVDPEFEVRKKGDYKGNIDQVKLRMAIMNGLQKMARNYDDLQYVGVIQVDTKHVHCHLAMVDRGIGNLTEDGTQKGKISEKNKTILRRGIDSYLEEKQPVHLVTSNITHDRRNLRCLVKKCAYQTLNNYGTPQYLLACLPEDHNMWRAGSHVKAMKKPNKIVRQYVEEILKLPDSGYKELLQTMEHYVVERKKKENLSNIESRKLIQEGKERIIRECMDGVYQTLKQIPEKELSVETAMLKIAGTDMIENAAIAKREDQYEFVYKLRSYSSRLEHHKKEMNKYRSFRKTYERANDCSTDSVALYRFFEIEEEYNEKLMSKYQHFLSFLPPEQEYEDEFKELMEYRNKLQSMKDMQNDKMPQRMNQKNAEKYCWDVYGMHGGRYMVSNPLILERRLEKMQETYREKKEEFENKLATFGLQLKGDHIERGPKYDFSEVKALDLHHLGYDFPEDVSISGKNVERFIRQTKERYEAYIGAKEYLERSGQGDTIFHLPNKDIEIMQEIACQLEEKQIIRSKIPNEIEQAKRLKTVEIREEYARNLKLSVQSTIQTLKVEEDYEFE